MPYNLFDYHEAMDAEEEPEEVEIELINGDKRWVQRDQLQKVKDGNGK